MSRISKLQSWLESESNKDDSELKLEKEKIIKEIKSIKKEDLFKQKEIPKLSFWQRLKKVLF